MAWTNSLKIGRILESAWMSLVVLECVLRMICASYTFCVFFVLSLSCLLRLMRNKVYVAESYFSLFHNVKVMPSQCPCYVLSFCKHTAAMCIMCTFSRMCILADCTLSRDNRKPICSTSDVQVIRRNIHHRPALLWRFHNSGARYKTGDWLTDWLTYLYSGRTCNSEVLCYFIVPWK